MAKTKKYCTKCKKEKNLDHFANKRRYKNNTYCWCNDCVRKYQNEYKRQWRINNPEKSKAAQHKYRIAKRYGLTVKYWNQMFADQDGRCAICMIPQDELNHTLCVDHNHKTGHVRQLVCKRCNMLIGVYEADFYGFKDKIKEYLEKNNG